MEKEKRCFVCGETKPLSAFHKHSRMADGHINRCKSCMSVYQKSYRKENSEVILEKTGLDEGSQISQKKLGKERVLFQKSILQNTKRKRFHTNKNMWS